MRLATLALSVAMITFSPLTMAKSDCSCDQKCMTECSKNGGYKNCKCKSCDCSKTGKCDHGKCDHADHKDEQPK